MPAFDLESLREQLLEASLPYLASEGWNEQALRQGARDLGLGSAEILLTFPGGVRDALTFFSGAIDRKMTESLLSCDLSELRVPQRIELAVHLRLGHLEPHREALRLGKRYLTLPQNLALASRLLWQTSDAIWYVAGDRSDDLNYYTKRTQLASILMTTTCYWLNDRSTQYRDTKDFLRRQLEAVGRFGRVISQWKTSLSYVPSPWRFVRQLRQRGWS